jgi:quercetin dioxygenase-like cupin family protein
MKFKKDYEQRKENIFFQNETLTARIVELKPGEKMPEYKPYCKMEGHVMFYVVKGEIQLRKNDEIETLKENQLFITEPPATLSFSTKSGAKIMGVHIK